MKNRVRGDPKAWLAGSLAVVAIAVGTGGCARHYWSKPGSTAEQFANDSRECARDAVAAVGLSMQQAYRDCLAARGYTREKKMDPPPPGFYRGIDDEGRSASR
jgi:hypothetical protein